MEPTMTPDQAQGIAAMMAGIGLIGMLISLAISIVSIIANWKIFSKAGQPGWAIFIPIYNAICFCRVIGKSDWWWLLCIIPIYGWFVIPIIAVIRLAKAFGKGTGFGIGMLIPGVNLILYLVLAFSAEYVGFPEEGTAQA